MPPEAPQPAQLECNHCGTYFPEDHAVCDAQGESLCLDCSCFCNTCNNYTSEFSYNYNMCAECVEEHIRCHTCETIIRVDDCFTSGWSRYCERCWNRRRAEEDYIHPYGYKPDAVFHSAEGTSHLPDPTKYYIGMEVETENPDGDWSALSDAVRDEALWYAKQDGSLTCGAEFVSHPIESETLLSEFDTYTAQITNLANSGFLSYHTSTCGVHMHVSRSAFVSELHLLKFVSMFVPCEPVPRRDVQGITVGGGMAGNDEDIVALIEVSKRRARQIVDYCQLDLGMEKSEAVKAERQYSSRRMASVNLQNATTVELRLFRGTLHPRSLKAYVQILVAAIRYSRLCRLSTARATSLFNHICTRAPEYPEAAAMIARRRGTQSADINER